jgi:hypothetical protein
MVIFCGGASSMRVVLTCRVIKQIITTFSNTVIATAALTDVLSGSELALGLSSFAATYGASLLVAPFAEWLLLRLSGGSPRYAYLMISALGSIQTIYTLFLIPETLEPAKRRPLDVAGALNVFGFLNIFRKGSASLRKMVLTTTFMMMAEGKNQVDMAQNLMTQRLGFSSSLNAFYISCCSVAYMLSGWYSTPFLMRSFSTRRFTTFANMAVALGFGVHGAVSRKWTFFVGLLMATPGINGAPGTKLRAMAADRAASQGFGRGEFQGWCNNMRALAGAVAPFTYGQYYAWADRSGIYPGTVFWVLSVVGALVPQVLLSLISDKELEADV